MLCRRSEELFIGNSTSSFVPLQRDSVKINVVERVFKYELTYSSNLCPSYRYSAIVGEEHDVVYSGIAIVIQNVWNISCR
jgi:hypothetical protein